MSSSAAFGELTLWNAKDFPTAIDFSLSFIGGYVSDMVF